MLQTVIRPSMERVRIAVPGVLEHVALAARHAELADRREHHVLGCEPERQRPDEVDLHRARPRLRQRLGREDVLHLGRADPDRQRTDGAVRRGVAVAADDRHPRL